MSWCPAVSVEDFIRGLVSPSPQLMNSRKLPSAHADRCPATVAAGQWVVLMVSTISFLIHPCFWGISINFVQFVSGRSKMVVGQSSFNLCISKDLARYFDDNWWLSTYDYKWCTTHFTDQPVLALLDHQQPNHPTDEKQNWHPPSHVILSLDQEKVLQFLSTRRSIQELR